jgi:hypothetical protein
MALHACGQLHRSAVAQAIAASVTALDLAPCCYVKGATLPYRPVSGGDKLRLDEDDLRLAVTGEATSGKAERERRRRENAWKSGFRALLRKTTGTTDYLPLSRIPAPWLAGDFAGFCTLLAQREGLALPALAPAWVEFETIGWRQSQTADQRNQLRLAFARALEVWLVMDLAVCLETAGYQVTVRPFCQASATPRNLLLSARA